MQCLILVVLALSDVVGLEPTTSPTRALTDSCEDGLQRLNETLACDSQRLEFTSKVEIMSSGSCDTLIMQVQGLDYANGAQDNETSAEAIAYVQHSLHLDTCAKAKQEAEAKAKPTPVNRLPVDASENKINNASLILAIAGGICGMLLVVAFAVSIGSSGQQADALTSLEAKNMPPSLPQAMSGTSYITSDPDPDPDSSPVEPVAWRPQDTDTTPPKPGWVQHVDPSDGKPYYHNNTTGATQWERPLDADSDKGEGGGAGSGTNQETGGVKEVAGAEEVAHSYAQAI
jgi:hypothetical protein